MSVVASPLRLRRLPNSSADGEQGGVGDGLDHNENKMSDSGPERPLLKVEMWKSSEKRSVRRPAVRSIAWLDVSLYVASVQFLCIGRFS